MCATGRKKKGDREVYEGLKTRSRRNLSPRIHKNDRYNSPGLQQIHIVVSSPHFIRRKSSHKEGILEGYSEPPVMLSCIQQGEIEIQCRLSRPATLMNAALTACGVIT